MPTSGWVIDLGANAGLFSVWAACAGARVVSVEAQQAFADEIRALADCNGVGDRVHIETALAASCREDARNVGVLADDVRWTTASHARGSRPPSIAMSEILQKYQIDRISLMKVDIEGSEFSLLNPRDDLSWLDKTDQMVLEVHPAHGNAKALVSLIRDRGFVVTLQDNAGRVVREEDTSLNYAYCTRVEGEPRKDWVWRAG